MRIALPLLLLLLASSAAYAQAPRIDRIDVGEFGIFTADTTGQVSAPGSVTGTRNVVTDIRLAETTRTIPAQLGVRFGFRYTVVGAPAGTIVPLQIVAVYPNPGVIDPATQQRAAESRWDAAVAIGTMTYSGYKFDNSWEIVPGVWTLQVWYQGRKLAEQSFTVVKR